MPAHVLLVGIAAALVLIGCGDDADPAAGTATTPVSPRMAATDVAAVELVTGDCISGLVIGVAERTMVDSVRVVDCGSVHELEVFATFDLTPEDFDAEETDVYPGQQRVVRAADEGCASRLEELGLEDELGLIAIWPTGPSWIGGDRGVKCAAFSKDRQPFEGRRVLAGAES